LGKVAEIAIDVSKIIAFYIEWRQGLGHLKLPQLRKVDRDFYDAAPPILNFGNLAILEAIRRASSFVSKFAEVRRPGSSS
jgi:hypothetical protein